MTAHPPSEEHPVGAKGAGAVARTSLPGLVARGKVRDLYDLGERLMIVATDRISAFDVVMNEPAPGKGILLTRLSQFWLETLPACSPHHLDYVVEPGRVPRGYEAALDELHGRAMVVRRATVLPIECVVRGYLAGGGWQEYRRSGSVSGVPLPPGLAQAERLPEPIFTPSTKAGDGHDQPISFAEACARVDPILMHEARRRALEIYTRAALYAEERGVLIADTKFEFGTCDGELLLIDEVLTPDSSRFWPADAHRVGVSPPSFDKQYLRDYLETIPWNKTAPPPPIPPEVIAQTRARYLDAFRRLTGRPAPVM